MRRTLQCVMAAAILGALPATSALATALDTKASGTKTFYVDQRAGANQVIINSEAIVEDFTGVINTVAGEFQLDPKNLENTKGKFSVRVTDIQTGIDLRDKDLQSPIWIDAARYPLVTITITGARGVQKKSTNSASLTFTGTCDLHGVSHDVQIPAKLVYLDESPLTEQRAPGDLIAVRANFSFKPSDYKISGLTGADSPRAIGQMVPDVQSVRVSVFASSQPPPQEGYGGMAPSQGTTRTPATVPTASQPTLPDTPASPSPPKPSGS